MKLSDLLSFVPLQSKGTVEISIPRMSILAAMLYMFPQAYATEPGQHSAITIQSLDQAITRAADVDPWLSGNRLRQQSLLSRSQSIQTLPDPKLSLSILNLPTDGLSFSQEPMTQLKLGVSQAFPRGDSQEIKQRHLHKLASQFPLLAKERNAQTAVAVSRLWIKAVSAQQGINYVESQQSVFKQLVDTVQSQYASGRLNTRQDDVVSAQLELSRILDRRTLLLSERDQAVAQLLELLSSDTIDVNVILPVQLPQLTNDWVLGTLSSQYGQRQKDIDVFLNHPAYLSIGQRQAAADEQVELVKQKHKPLWSVNASYAHRQDNAAGDSRADFFSVGVSVDMPLFTSSYIDSDIRAEQLNKEALKTEQRLLIRSMLSELNTLRSQYKQNQRRLQLYQEALVPQLYEQSQASLNAYTNGEANFKQVMAARKAQFDGELAMIDVAAKQQILNSQAAYFVSHQFSSARKDISDE